MTSETALVGVRPIMQPEGTLIAVRSERWSHGAGGAETGPVGSPDALRHKL